MNCAMVPAKLTLFIRIALGVAVRPRLEAINCNCPLQWDCAFADQAWLGAIHCNCPLQWDCLRADQAFNSLVLQTVAPFVYLDDLAPLAISLWSG